MNFIEIKTKESFHSTEADKRERIPCDYTTKLRTLQREWQK